MAGETRAHNLNDNQCQIYAEIVQAAKGGDAAYPACPPWRACPDLVGSPPLLLSVIPTGAVRVHSTIFGLALRNSPEGASGIPLTSFSGIPPIVLQHAECKSFLVEAACRVSPAKRQHGGKAKSQMPTFRNFRVLFLLALVLGTVPVARADAIFNFASDALGTSTPFSNTSNGLTATFSTSVGPGGFVIATSSFATFTGNVLLDPGPGSATSIPLTIAFSNNAIGISMDYATTLLTPFTLTAFENGSQVGQVSASGVIPSGYLSPEGVISFNGAIFNSVVLSSSAPFAIDNVNVMTPEPSSFLLLGIGMVGLAVAAKRKMFGP